MARFGYCTRALACIFAVAALGACANATTKVAQPVVEPLELTTVNFERRADTVMVTDDVRAHFEKRLNEYMIEKGSFSPGNELTVSYRFVQMDKGSRAERYFLGPFGGKGTMVIEVFFLDANQNMLSNIEVGGEIAGGFFGGDFDEAVSKAAKEVSTFAEQYFTANQAR